MTGERLFLDTSFILAPLNRPDEHHVAALALVPRLANAREVVVTESVLVELGDGVSRDAPLRGRAVQLIRGYYAQPNCTVVPTDTALLRDALALYARHDDKAWGMTDCISFVVMRRMGLRSALTADRHFVQAGFEALMAEDPTRHA